MTDIIIFLIIFSLFYLILLFYVAYMVYATVSGAPFVPTRSRNVVKMIELANLTDAEKVIDLGSGEGRIVFAVASHCEQSVGVEINPFLYWISRLKQRVSNCKNQKRNETRKPRCFLRFYFFRLANREERW
ncbi:MAG: hypothetical protein HZC26_01770 [Candidatus Magasanikbacteria bacterium]|nr:hypothetical protein [Candidatus Magasanikbacteria bacterium]